MNESQTKNALETAREQVRYAVERLQEIRADLLETVVAVPAPAALEDGFDLAGLSELDAVVRCALHDHMKPLIESLRGLARSKLERKG